MMTLYTQPYCQPCKQVKRKLDEMGADYEVVDDLVEFAAGVRSVPTLSHGNRLITGGTAIHKYLTSLENK